MHASFWEKQVIDNVGTSKDKLFVFDFFMVTLRRKKKHKSLSCTILLWQPLHPFIFTPQVNEEISKSPASLYYVFYYSSSLVCMTESEMQRILETI